MPANLKATGIAVEGVDAVLMTHFDLDYVGGLTDEADAPMFPRAQLYLSQEESAYWASDDAEKWRRTF